MKKTVAVLALCVLTLSGCQSLDQVGIMGQNAHQLSGEGILFGGMLGSEIQPMLEQSDLDSIHEANLKAHEAPLGKVVSWDNPQTQHFGTVTPVRDGYSASGLFCREYSQNITVGNLSKSAYGSACQRADGRWVAAR